MPELPEVETIVKGLNPNLLGRTIEEVNVFHPDVLRQPPQDFSAELRGRTFDSVSRRGKNIVACLTGDTVLVVNLGMTGRLLLTQKGSDATHPAVRFILDFGPKLVFDDVRRFGVVEVLSGLEWKARARQFGPEPLSAAFTAKKLLAGLKESGSPIRSWLLNQRRLAGVGNIYANEALHIACIHPQRPARSITGREARRLHRALRSTLRQALANRGTTLRDYRDASGAPGGNAAALTVYGRVGEPCHRCSAGIERAVFGNRSAFLCPICQPYEPGGKP